MTALGLKHYVPIIGMRGSLSHDNDYKVHLHFMMRGLSLLYRETMEKDDPSLDFEALQMVIFGQFQPRMSCVRAAVMLHNLPGDALPEQSWNIRLFTLSKLLGGSSEVGYGDVPIWVLPVERLLGVDEVRGLQHGLFERLLPVPKFWLQTTPREFCNWEAMYFADKSKEMLELRKRGRPI